MIRRARCTGPMILRSPVSSLKPAFITMWPKPFAGALEFGPKDIGLFSAMRHDGLHSGACLGLGGGKHDDYSTDALASFSPALDRLVRFSLSGEWKEGALWQAIAELNDGTSYSREEIGDWLSHEGGCKHEIGALRIVGGFSPWVPLELLRES